eukprot:TRINITY_DN97199_c0_g1_i1.p1 TRINITY_DN97199_c0_g1~~TRINITY_DN97199_c0_g1_i1.p1  ORF type:complete len:272 (-),score=23.14 TRINITY_DN97199_c0_g1_i1:249-1064(-)
MSKEESSNQQTELPVPDDRWADAAQFVQSQTSKPQPEPQSQPTKDKRKRAIVQDKPKSQPQAQRDDGWEFISGLGAGVVTSGLLLCTPLAATAGTFALWHTATVAAGSCYMETSPSGAVGWLISPIVVPVGAVGLGAVGAVKLAEIGHKKAKELGCKFRPANCCVQHFTGDSLLTGYHFWCADCQYAVCIHCSNECHKNHQLSNLKDAHYRCGCESCLQANDMVEQEAGDGWQNIEFAQLFDQVLNGVPQSPQSATSTNSKKENEGSWVVL